ncbi:HAD family hydrolase [Adhaeribacter sp. BT258]|uniref:D,D-heptose 1,7-bisphosphate phosphatase n=1 Tax=Adhaeribacter terrigena TaxID=2793070 RepID=A0ABS1BYG6_9BACT|nr:HAD family hydrolase [Adhaeribacter terrigena]MBK0402167.1 HAD family hydrolase [Adhaeribacter terrigena]
MENDGKSKAVFLDRDGVLNVERGEYTFRTEEFEVLAGVPEALKLLKEAGYLLIVVTNQGGIAKGLYTKAAVLACHEKLQQACGNRLDALYFAPSHPSVSESLSRKPDSLMLEKAIARFNISTENSWLVGDRKRDLEAAARVGVKSILVGEEETYSHPVRENDLLAAAKFILRQEK